MKGYIDRETGHVNTIEPLNEEHLERLYWEFDAERAKKNYSERDCFKHVMRRFAHAELKRYLLEE